MGTWGLVVAAAALVQQLILYPYANAGVVRDKPKNFEEEQALSEESLRDLWESAPQASFDYTPNRSSLQSGASVLLPKTWNETVRFIYNRGEKGVHFESELLKMIELEQIRALPNYRGPSFTRISLVTYEIRSIKVVQRLAELLQKGFNVRVVSDPSTFTLLKKPSAEEQAKWAQNQKAYYLHNYDKNRDGQVDEDDLAKINRDRHLSHEIWSMLEQLQKKYPDQFALISSPYEMIPMEEGFLYPRLTHVKNYSVDFLRKNNTTNEISWAPQRAFIASANITDSCMDRRVSQSEENKKRFLNGEDYRYAKGSQGHIQFGAILTGEDVIAPLLGPLEEWIALYTKGKHFDSAKTKGKLYSRVVLEGKGKKSAKKPRTWMQAFYSEGTKVDGRKPLDPVWAITKILSQPNVILKKYYDAQFVFVHKAMARHLRHHLARGTVEEFGVFVDGNFAVEPFSAIQDLVFAPKIQNVPLVRPGTAIQDFIALPESVNWQDNIFVFEGERGVFGGPGDKLHSKVTYFEYLDAENIRHYVVVWGSANKSSNAGKLNADGSIIFDSTDPKVGTEVLPFFRALRAEATEENGRMKSYADAFLERRFLEMIEATSDAGQKLFHGDFISRFKMFLNKPGSRKQLERLVEELIAAGPVRSFRPEHHNQEDILPEVYGANLLRILKWLASTQGPVEKAGLQFGWSEFYLALQLAHPDRMPEPGFTFDLKTRWINESAPKDVGNSFDRMLGMLERSGMAKSQRPTPLMLEIMNQSSAACERLLIPRYTIPNYKGTKGGTE